MTYQRGSLKKLPRKGGETWVLRYRVTKPDGRRVEHIMPVGLVRKFPKEKDAWREVDRRGLLVRINDEHSDVRIRFDALAEHYLKADFGEYAVRPKSDNTITITNHIVRDYLMSRWGSGDRRGHQAPRDSALAQVAPRRLRSRLDNDLEDAGRHEPHFQGRHAPWKSLQESRSECRDACQNQLPGYHHYPGSDVWHSESTEQHPAFHACVDLRGNGAPLIGDSGTALG